MNRPKRTIFVVIPAYNEEANIGNLLDHISEAMEEAAISFIVIVVNDGSRDSTARIVEERSAHMHLTVVRHETNLGLGATLRDGLFQAATMAAPQDIIVTMDADETHTLGLILRMVRMISEGFDVVIASRYHTGSRTVGVPLARRALSRVASWLFRLTFPIRGVHDFTCGFRAYRATVIQSAVAEYGQSFVDQDGFQCMVDILLKLRRRPLIFGEVPFILRYDFKKGGTKMDIRKTVLNTLRLMIKRRFQQ
jgi:dolichol-phosphate mannosyltransferase